MSNNPATIQQAFDHFPGGVSSIPKSAPRIDLSFCNDDISHLMRKLWCEHIEWSRYYIIEAVYDQSETAKKATAQRLLQNQIDIGNAMKPLFGEEMGKILTELLKEHIYGLVRIVEAGRNNQMQKKKIEMGRQYANGRKIIRFLHQFNSRYWDINQLERAMREHLDNTFSEINARINKDAAGDIRSYEAVKTKITAFSDYLSMGIKRLTSDRQRGIAD